MHRVLTNTLRWCVLKACGRAFLQSHNSTQNRTTRFFRKYSSRARPDRARPLRGAEGLGKVGRAIIRCLVVLLSLPFVACHRKAKRHPTRDSAQQKPDPDKTLQISSREPSVSVEPSSLHRVQFELNLGVLAQSRLWEADQVQSSAPATWTRGLITTSITCRTCSTFE